MKGLMNFLDSQKANGYLVLRIVAAVVLIWHGYGKLFGFGISGVAGFFGDTLGLPIPMVLAVLVTLLEFFGGIAILLGICTRLLGIWMIVQFGLIVIWIKPAIMGVGFAAMDKTGFELDLLLFGIGVLLATNGAGIAALGPKLMKNMPWCH
jgi:putative oxidoreductase